MEGKSDVYNAMQRDGLGKITFPYTALSSVDHSTRDSIPEIIIRGKTSKPYSGGRKIDITYGKNSATFNNVGRNIWELSEIKKD